MLPDPSERVQRHFGTHVDRELFGFTDAHCTILGLNSCLDEPKSLSHIISTSNKDATDTLGRTCLMWACAIGDLSSAKILVGKGSEVNERDHMGYTALHWWAQGSRNRELLDLLLSAGADVNVAESMYGETALQKLVRYSPFDSRIADQLLHYGSSMSSKDGFGFTLLHNAIRASNKKAFAWIMHNISSNPPVWADIIDVRGSFGMTPLLTALAYNDYQSFSQLLAAGVDPSISNQNRWHMFHYLAMNADIATLASLGCRQWCCLSMEDKDKNGDTMLQLAISKAVWYIPLVELRLWKTWKNGGKHSLRSPAITAESAALSCPAKGKRSFGTTGLLVARRAIFWLTYYSHSLSGQSTWDNPVSTRCPLTALQSQR